MSAISSPTGARKTRYRPIRGAGAAVVAGHPLAVAAGMRILDRGGNAVDAAIATAAAVAVVRPHMCGVAGDGFFLIYDAAAARVHALNAGGPAPAAVTPAHFRGGMPDRGGVLSTVPGILDGWSQAHARFGTLPWAELLQPAIELAERGFPMYESFNDWIRKYRDKYRANAACAAVLLPGGDPPAPGTLFRQPDLGGTFRRIAERGARDFYEGELGATFARGLADAGGLVTTRDLAAYHAGWGEPVRAAYRGHVLHTPPPLSQGWMLAQMLSALRARTSERSRTRAGTGSCCSRTRSALRLRTVTVGSGIHGGPGSRSIACCRRRALPRSAPGCAGARPPPRGRTGLATRRPCPRSTRRATRSR